jgi:formylglycine-generating enzyme required for sulfatase activity
MAKYEITWDLYELYLNRNIDTEKNDKGNEVLLPVDGVSSATMPYIDMSDGMGKNGFPVVNVTQYAAATFCKWLSAKTGLFYRLPTEAEWEYACRAGTSTTFSFGDNEKELDQYGWFFENSNSKYHPVGEKLPNPFGLYEMHGNVGEWTLDRYDANGYPVITGVAMNPWNKAEELYPRVTRGGSWYDDAEELTSSARKPSNKNWKKIDPQIPKSLWWHTNAPFTGFRVVRPLKTPSKEEMEEYWLKAIKEL